MLVTLKGAVRTLATLDWLVVCILVVVLVVIHETACGKHAVHARMVAQQPRTVGAYTILWDISNIFWKVF